MSSLKFGTSGLRGLVSELTDAVCTAYTRAFLNHMQDNYGTSAGTTVLVGYDLRSSSPRIAAACMAAISDAGMRVENCGPLPTPALALRAMSLALPAIMVTGSHIPDDRNGLKFYRPDGEIDKADEAGILAFLDLGAPEPLSPTGQSEIVGIANDNYAKRYVGILQPNVLVGRRIGVYQHSSVARDLIVGVLEGLGTDVVALGRSDVFVPVDTEALRPEDIAFATTMTKKHRLDALVSTDGDADRPLIADEAGTFLRGDSVGILTARFLNADAVVTPVTSNTAVELSGLFTKVYRTKVGSPHVIAGMEKAASDHFQRVVGFEANGGVLLGSDIVMEGGLIEALPTRDAMLPILAVLGMAAKQAIKVSELVGTLPQRFTRSGRIEHVEPALSGPFLKSLGDENHRNNFFSPLGPIEDYDSIDGNRVVLATGDVVHFRASGNAPELRCYSEAASSTRADYLLQWGLERAEEALELYKK